MIIGIKRRWKDDIRSKPKRNKRKDISNIKKFEYPINDKNIIYFSFFYIHLLVIQYIGYSINPKWNFDMW